MSKMKKIGETKNEYSIYENPDKDMVEKIKSIDMGDITVTDVFPFGKQEFKLKEVTDRGKYLMEGVDGDYITIKKDEYERLIKEKKLFKINTEFDANEVMNKYMLPFVHGRTVISECRDLYEGRTKEEIAKLINMGTHGRWYTFDGVHCYAYESESEYYGSIPVKEISFTHKPSGPNCTIYLDEDGNLRNRNYHINFDKPGEYVSVEEYVKLFIGLLENLECDEFKYHKEKWFTDEYVWVYENLSEHEREDDAIRFRFIRVPKTNYTSYYIPGQSHSKYKLPKSAKTVNKQHMVDFAHEIFINLGELADPMAGEPYIHNK